MAIRRSTYLKIGLGLVWLGMLAAGIFWIHSFGVPLRRMPHVLHELLRGLGYWGPLVVLALYVVRPLFFIPASALAIVSGTLYGPVIGVVLNVVGDCLSASVAFLLGRVFGRRFVREHERGWLKKYDTILKEEGFFPVLFMRLLFFPFDTVSIACGMTGMIFRQYLLGTLLGILPGTITLTLLGDAFARPESIATFVGLFAVTLVLVFFAQRSPWVRSRLFPKDPPPERINF